MLDRRWGRGSSRRSLSQDPDAPLHRPDVERQSSARGRACRLGRDRPGVAHRLAALAGKAQRSLGRGGPQPGPLALGAARCGRRPGSAGWAWQTRRRRKDRLLAAQTSGSPRPSGTRTPPIARSRRSTFSRRTGCWSRATRTTWTRPSGSASTSICASSWTR